jgi:hypothetical protein
MELKSDSWNLYPISLPGVQSKLSSKEREIEEEFNHFISLYRDFRNQAVRSSRTSITESSFASILDIVSKLPFLSSKVAFVT